MIVNIPNAAKPNNKKYSYLKKFSCFIYSIDINIIKIKLINEIFLIKIVKLSTISKLLKTKKSPVKLFNKIKVKNKQAIKIFAVIDDNNNL